MGKLNRLSEWRLLGRILPSEHHLHQKLPFKGSDEHPELPRAHGASLVSIPSQPAENVGWFTLHGKKGQD